MAEDSTGRTKNKFASYEKKYTEGGWQYDYAREYKRVKTITDAIGLKPGATVLEIGCGEGFHSQLLYDLGFRVTGNEMTDAGVRNARKNHPTVNYIQGDSLSLVDILPLEHFDMILARGHSWYHYHLTEDDPRGINPPAKTRRMFDLIKPGGHFVLVIRTDFTGTHPEKAVSNNTRQAYVDLFSPFGEIVYVTDRHMQPLPDEAAARASGKGIVIATRKPGGRREGRKLPPPIGRALRTLRKVSKRLARRAELRT